MAKHPCDMNRQEPSSLIRSGKKLKKFVVGVEDAAIQCQLPRSGVNVVAGAVYRFQGTTKGLVLAELSRLCCDEGFARTTWNGPQVTDSDILLSGYPWGETP